MDSIAIHDKDADSFALVNFNYMNITKKTVAMSKNIILALFFVSSTSVFSSQDAFESIKSEIALENAAVDDYFLACQSCDLQLYPIPDNGFFFRRRLLTSKSLEYPLREDSETGAPYKVHLSVDDKIIDHRNGYLMISGIDEELSYAYAGAVFISHEKKKFFAWTSYHEGGDSDSYSFQFFMPTSGKWHDVTDEVMPEYSFEDFRADKRDIKYNGEVEWQIILPQYGTTVYLVPHPSYETAETQHLYENYRQDIGKNVALEMVWDKQSGRFVKGKLLDRNALEYLPKWLKNWMWH